MTAFACGRFMKHKMFGFADIKSFFRKYFKGDLLRNEQRKWVKVFKNRPSKTCEDSLQNIWRDMICLSRAYPFKFFESCLPEILVGPFLNTLFHIIISKPFVTLSHSSFVTIVQTSKQLCENMKNIGYMFTQTGFKIYFH